MQLLTHYYAVFSWCFGPGSPGYEKVTNRFGVDFRFMLKLEILTVPREIDTYERLNRDEKQSKEEDGHEDDWRDPFFEFKVKRANTAKS